MTEAKRPRPGIAPLQRIAFGAQSTQVLYVAAKLGLADLLGDGRRSAAELARADGVDAAALQRVLRGLVALGVCDESANGGFGLTAHGQLLRSDHPESVQARALLNAEVHYALWGDLLATVKTGESASQRVFGAPFFEHLARDAAAGALFDRAMTSAGWLQRRFRAAIEAYDFDRFDRIVDVGGGDGALMVELLKTCPRPSGIVFDVPRLAASARRTIEAARLTERCRFVGGDASAAVPAGADAYILSNFVNGFGDEAASVPMRHCRDAMAAGGRLLLVEWIMPDCGGAAEDPQYWDAVTMDLVMLAAFGSRGGRIRTRAEFLSLLAAGGFTVKAVIPKKSSVYVIEAAPA